MKIERISNIQIELCILRMRRSKNKADCFKSLDDTFSDILSKNDMITQISEEICNYVETTKSITRKLNPQKIAWVEEWVKTKERKNVLFGGVNKVPTLTEAIGSFIRRHSINNETAHTTPLHGVIHLHEKLPTVLNQSQQEGDTQKGKRIDGKKKESQFSDIIQLENKEAFLNRLHSLIDVCNSGVDIAAILSKATLDKHLIRLPRKVEVSNEFNLPCTWEAVRKNLIDNDKFKDDKRYIAAQKIVMPK